MKQPIILVTCDTDEEKHLLRKAYVHTLAAHGAIPLIAPTSSSADFHHLASIADGLLLSGGSDIHPKHFGETIAPYYEGTIDPYRYEFESALLDAFTIMKHPILGICRGMQTLNVYFGGTLYQDIDHDLPGALAHRIDRKFGADKIAHQVHITPGTQLHGIIDATEIGTNSFHHQGVHTLAPTLKESARTVDGLIEGLEHPDHPFLIGVEWHPEELHDVFSHRLFAAFLDAASVRVC